MKVTAWPLAMYGYDRWAIKKDEEVRMNAFEIKCICHILMVSLTERDEKLVSVGFDFCIYQALILRAFATERWRSS